MENTLVDEDEKMKLSHMRSGEESTTQAEITSVAIMATEMDLTNGC
jgi:hypothetical protein